MTVPMLTSVKIRDPCWKISGSESHWCIYIHNLHQRKWCQCYVNSDLNCTEKACWWTMLTLIPIRTPIFPGWSVLERRHKALTLTKTQTLPNMPCFHAWSLTSHDSMTVPERHKAHTDKCRPYQTCCVSMPKAYHHMILWHRVSK